MAHTLIHLSDIHFHPNAEKNSVISRIDAICRAVVANTSPEVPGTLVLSGDLANTGSPAEYEIGMSFIEKLVAGINSHFSFPLNCIAVPGNHDCTLSETDSVRQIILDSIRRGKSLDDQLVDACLKAQKEFQSFAERLNQIIPTSFPKSLVEIVQPKDSSVAFALLNTASQCERNDVPGHFVFPVERLEKSLETVQGCHLIAIMHHPYNWMDPNCARSLRKALEQYTSVILTGHEHVADIYMRERQPQEQNLYIEGGVLQETDDPDSSAFNLVNLETTKAEFTVQTLRWDSDRYTTQKDVPVQQIIRQRTRLAHRLPIADEMANKLDDPGMAFTHPRTERVKLSDLFVYRDFNKIDQSRESQPVGLLKGRELINYVLAQKHLLITGSEKSGKTTLAKRLFLDLQDAGFCPLLWIDSYSLPARQDKIKKILTEMVAKQYGNSAVEGYWQLYPKERAVILDGYDRLGINSHGRDELVRFLEDHFEVVVIIGSDEILINDLTGPEGERKAIWTYYRLSILELGRVGRYKLVRRWVTLGRDFSDDENAVYRETVQMDHTISNLLLRNLLPSQPHLVLMLLQQLETKTSIASSSGSFGHLYDFIIKARLARVSCDNAELEGHLTYLSEIANRLHNKNADTVPEADIHSWHNQYCEAYARQLDFDHLINQFVNEQVLDRRHGGIGFRYRYYKCFFLARHIANHLDDDPDSRKLVETLATSLHLRDAGDTMMFLCHLSKNRLIVESILEVARSQFAEISPYDLTVTPQLGFDSKVGHPALTLNDGSPEDNRMRLMEATDEAERTANVSGDSSDTATIALQAQETEEQSLLNIASQINAAFKTVQITGQIVRNFYGSLKAEEQQELVQGCYTLGLRVLGKMFELLTNTDGLRDEFTRILKVRRPNVKEKNLEEYVSRMIYLLVQSMAFGTIKHISNSVGLAQLKITLDKIMQDLPSPSFRILDLSVRLDHFEDFPLNELQTAIKEVHSNYFAMGLVRILAWHHFFVFPEDHSLIQSVCSKLQIRLPSDRFLNPATKKIGSRGSRSSDKRRRRKK